MKGQGGGKILQFSHWLMNDSLDQDSFEDSDQEPVVLLANIKNAEFSFVKLNEESINKSLTSFLTQINNLSILFPPKKLLYIYYIISRSFF